MYNLDNLLELKQVNTSNVHFNLKQKKSQKLLDGIEVGGCGLEMVGVSGGDTMAQGTDWGRRGEGLLGAAIHAPECTGVVGQAPDDSTQSFNHKDFVNVPEIKLETCIL